MDEAIDFLEKAIDVPEQFLGINQSDGINIAIAYLQKVKDPELNTLLSGVLVKWFDSFLQANVQSYSKGLSIFEPANKLLNSVWRVEAMEKLTELYIQHSTKENALEALIENYFVETNEQSVYLASEKLADYFRDTRIESATGVQQAIYCCHVLNAAFSYQIGNATFDGAYFAECVKDKLLYALESAGDAVKNLAIWALYWLAGSRDGQIETMLPYHSSWVQRLANLHYQDLPLTTQLRLCTILARASVATYKDVRKKLTREWGLQVFQKKINESNAVIFANTGEYGARIENVLLQSLDLPGKIWIEEFVIPYLGLYASSDAIRILKENLEKQEPVKSRSAIILCGAGALTSDDCDKYKLAQSKHLEELLITSGGHLIHKLKAKDTTGRWAYYFVWVEEDQTEKFLKAIEGDATIDLEDYGRVVASCYGETPTAEVINYLKEKYGFEV